MADNDPDFAARNAQLEGLPITQQLMQRLNDLADAEGGITGDDAVAPIVAAIHALERAFQGV